MRKTSRRRENGFSLIEVLVSMALMFISLIGAAELLVHALRTEAKAESTAEMVRAAAGRLETFKSAISGGAETLPEARPPLEDGTLPFSVLSRRGNVFLGRWIPAGPSGEPRLRRWGFEICSELEPDAAVEFVILVSPDLGF